MKKILIGATLAATTLLTTPYAIAHDNASNKANAKAITASPTTSDDQTVENPVHVLNKSVITIQRLLTSQTKELEKNPKELLHIVRTHLIPYMDLDDIAGNMLGKKWNSASAQDKKEFITGFMNMLVLLYSKNIAQVGDYELKFNPLRPSADWKSPNTKNVQVTGVLFKKGSESKGSNVVVYLKKTSQNTWKIYDVAIEGVSIIQNYRSQFRSLASVSAAIAAVKKVNERNK